MILKPHDNTVLPSYFRNFSEFNFKFFNEIFEVIKNQLTIKSVIFFGVGFNKADSYFFHQVFDLISLNNDFEYLYIYCKTNEVKKIKLKVNKYISIRDKVKII
ncbi:MAG: hypothetical protein ACRCXQ_05740, partial [Vagococcus fluvialis]